MARDVLGIDPKKYTHVSSDDKKTTLRHKDGHVLTIMHSVLSPKMQAALKSLSKIPNDAKTSNQSEEAESDEKRSRTKFDEGGRVAIPDSARPDTEKATVAKEISTGSKQAVSTPSWDEIKAGWWKPAKKAEGGEVVPHNMPQMYAEGTPEETIGQSQPTNEVPMEQFQPEVPKHQVEVQKLYNSMVSGIPDTPSGAMFQTNEKPWAMFGPNGEPPKSFDANAWKQAEQTAEKQNAAAQNVSQQKVQQIMADNEVRARAGLPPLAVPGMDKGPQQPPQASEPQSGSMVPQQTLGSQPGSQNAMASGIDQTEGMLRQGYNQRLQGIQQGAAAQGALGEEQARVHAKFQEAQQNAQLAYKQSFDMLEAERQNHMQDIRDGYIDPNKYWDNHSKMSAAIGMILAGFNPTNRPNAAVELLKHQMDQNIQAQMKNLDSKQNLLAGNLRQFGNLRDATDMTRIMQNDIMKSQLEQAAAKAQSPMAKAAALDAAGKLAMETAPIFQQFNMRRAMMHLTQNGGDAHSVEQLIGYMRMTNPEMAKEMESRYVPGVGLAVVPVPEKVRDQLIGQQQMNTAAKDLINFVKTHTTLNPMSKDYATGQQKAITLQSLVREGKLGTVYREGEQPLLDKFVNSNPAGAMKLLQTVPKLVELLHSSERDTNVLRKNYGLPPVAQEQSMPSNEPVKGKDGKMYVRQGNYMVPVK